MPGGSLTSKPTWSKTSGCSAASVFLFLVVEDIRYRCGGSEILANSGSKSQRGN